MQWVHTCASGPNLPASPRPRWFLGRESRDGSSMPCGRRPESLSTLDGIRFLGESHEQCTRFCALWFLHHLSPARGSSQTLCPQLPLWAPPCDLLSSPRGVCAAAVPVPSPGRSLEVRREGGVECVHAWHLRAGHGGDDPACGGCTTGHSGTQ